MSLVTARRACPQPVGPASGAVDVGLVDLTADDVALARAESSLTPAEVAAARRGTPAVHRRRVLLRAALRAAVGAELGLAPSRVPLTTGPLGRPVVPAFAGIDVSCSASGALGIVAVGRGVRIGVDLEAVVPWSSDVLDEGWLAPGERRALAALPPADRAVAATRCWTQKEAVLKGRGTGLRDDLAATATVVGRTDGDVAGWQVRDVPVPGGWVATLAVVPAKEIRS